MHILGNSDGIPGESDISDAEKEHREAGETHEGLMLADRGIASAAFPVHKLVAGNDMTESLKCFSDLFLGQARAQAQHGDRSGQLALGTTGTTSFTIWRLRIRLKRKPDPEPSGSWYTSDHVHAGKHDSILDISSYPGNHCP